MAGLASLLRCAAVLKVWGLNGFSLRLGCWINGTGVGIVCVGFLRFREVLRLAGRWMSFVLYIGRLACASVVVYGSWGELVRVV